MFYARGGYSNQFLSRVKQANEQIKRVIANEDVNTYYFGELDFQNSSRFVYRVDTTDQTVPLSNYGFSSGTYAPQLGTTTGISGADILNQNANKILISYTTFGNYKQTNNRQWVDGANICVMKTDYVRLNINGRGDIICAFDNTADELENYQNTDTLDNWIVLLGFALYDDDLNIITNRKQFIYRLKFNTYIESARGGIGGRNISNALPKISNISNNFTPLGGGIIPNLIGNQHFNWFGKTYIPSLYAPSETNVDYSYSPMEALNGFKIIGVPYGNISTLKVGLSDIGYKNVQHLRNIILFESLEILVNYLTDNGFEVYLTLEDLIEGQPEEGGDDYGYNPPEEPEPIPDNTSDDVTPLLPNISPASLSKTYCLKLAEYRQFNQWIASTDFLDALSKYFTDPMDGVLSLKLYPFDFYKHESAYLTEESQIVIVNQSRDIHSYLFLNQYNFVFNGGTLTYPPYYGDFNDYLASYTLYIPFVGTVGLDPSEVVGKALRITYGVDILSGQCQVLLYSNNTLIRSMAGVCGLDIPLTGTNYTQAVRNAVNYAVGLGTSIATTLATGIPAVAVGATTAASVAGEAGGSLGIGAIKGAQTAIEALPNNATQHQTKSSPCTALFAPQVPYLNIILPQPVYPANRQQLQGYNASATVKISALEGYCKGTPYGDWDITGATINEINMIKQIIQSGFYI